jgi:hypothetical protein
MRLRPAAALAAILALALAPSAFAHSAPKVRGPVEDSHHTGSRSSSSNWSGYDVTGTGASHVVGSWTQTAATCRHNENSWSSPWVGIDGDTSNTVEQIGTDTDCSRGKPAYYAWYEMYPKSLVVINMTVTPGDSYTGEVTAGAPGQYTLKLTDNTTNATFSTVQSAPGALNASVEWIMEGPSNNGLTNFGTVSFTGAAGAINGQNGLLGSALTNPDPITMVGKKNVVRAQPFGLSAGSFGVTWQHS